jgi:hypothetical protein
VLLLAQGVGELLNRGGLVGGVNDGLERALQFNWI